MSDFDNEISNAASLRQSTWSIKVVIIGLCALLLWRSTSFIDRELIAAIPMWLLFILTTVIPHLLMLIYPLVTRKQSQSNRFRLPKFKRLLIEAVIAVPVIIGCLVLVSAVQYLITQLSPGSTAVPEIIDRMSKSTGSSFAYGFLLASFMIGPISEEIFFRGFLFNAFRKRTPLVVSILLTSVIFGFVHTFGMAHAIVASLLGIILTLVYCWRKTIFAPIFVHIGYNGIAALAVFLSMYANANTAVLGVKIKEPLKVCLIEAITPNSPAEVAGMLPGDTITKFNDYQITDFQSLLDTIFYYEAGDSLITVVRGNNTLQIQVVLISRASLKKHPQATE